MNSLQFPLATQRLDARQGRALAPSAQVNSIEALSGALWVTVSGSAQGLFVGFPASASQSPAITGRSWWKLRSDAATLQRVSVRRSRPHRRTRNAVLRARRLLSPWSAWWCGFAPNRRLAGPVAERRAH